MDTAELVFVPSPGMGHLVSMVEAANLLLHRDDRLSITVLIIRRSSDTKVPSYIDSVPPSDRLRFINLPIIHLDNSFRFDFIGIYKPHVKEAVSKLTADHSSLAGFVLDMFCTSMIDVANEFAVPSYIFYTSSAAFLSFTFHSQLLHDEHQVDPTQFKDSDTELAVPSLANPLPARVLPRVLVAKESFHFVLTITRSMRQVKGILVNSFMDLESHAFNSLYADASIPPVYSVGPIVNLQCDVESSGSNQTHMEIMEWLNDQPSSSVVFLCFGSMGGFNDDQVKEIAYALERSGQRFLWSLRQPPPKDNVGLSIDYENVQEVLPAGFLDRTAAIGKIIGWAPQVAVLAHQATGGFVSHCGWNSILESLWFGVPIATWPMYAEQQFNAFEMVTELGLAVEIKMDYVKDSGVIVSAEEIERGIRCLMEQNNDRKKKVKEMSEKSRQALMTGGSSSSSLSRLIQNMIDNAP